MLSKLFGTKNSRELKRMQRTVVKVNALESELEKATNDDLAESTTKFRARLADGERLDDLIPEVFAAVREAGKRGLDKRHYDVQLIGGIAMHEGNIAEMRTGEGKTMAATLAAYLNALVGKVHIVTVNDYLARRDANWMGPIYRALGMQVGVVQSNQDRQSKQEAYQADITYGTNNEFGFDYLRDNMAFSAKDKVQGGLDFAIVDEVDSILIDEARTPLIISGQAEESTTLYLEINKLAPKLTQQEKVESGLPRVLAGEDADQEDDGDFFIDEKSRQVELTERGHEFVETELRRVGLLGAEDTLYSSANLGLLHHVHAALKAHFLFKRDIDYMVQGQEIVIVDEHTGRAMEGRRWSEGIHQAVEAKEGVAIQRETHTLASTTFQNYFRLYGKLAGMTGTADTEAFEFKQIYGLDVLLIPTNAPMIRDDANDHIYMTIDEKYDAIVADVTEARGQGRPILVGTASIESSERLSKELKRRGIEHSVLNAKQHEREAQIVAEAGRPGVVTIATNMAGRGTDIVLGGNWEAEIEALGEDPPVEDVERIKQDWEERHRSVVNAGGLHIIGTERHESRRIDNQLRGRAGRQGDPGSSRFYLSMEDNLLRIFVSERMRTFLANRGVEEGEAIEAPMLNRAIEKAQRRVEGHNFDIRKNLLEYDDVANDQRQMIYQQRNELMVSEDISEMIAEIRREVVDDVVSDFIPPESIEEQWDVEGLEQTLASEFNLRQSIGEWLANEDDLNEDGVRDRIAENLEAAYGAKTEDWQARGIDMRMVEKQLMLQVLDQKWKDHLATMDYMRQNIHLRAYAQKQPKQEYKRESFALFQELLYAIKRDITRFLMRLQLESEAEIEAAERTRREAEARRMQYNHGAAEEEAAAVAAGGGGRVARRPQRAAPAPKVATIVRTEKKVGRNEPCPCGSGKKYKQCHGKAS